MTNPADVSVLISCNVPGIGRTLRMALRGMGVRRIFLASDDAQLAAGFASAEPQVVIVYLDGPDEADDGLKTLRYIRRSPESPYPRIPVIAVSQQRDLQTINAAINGGAHEYVLFPSSGDVLLKKITAARNSGRPFIETADYVGPERKVDRDGPHASVDVGKAVRTG